MPRFRALLVGCALLVGACGGSSSAPSPDAACGQIGDTCAGDSSCCLGSCDLVSHTCTQAGGSCAAASAPCGAPTDCCSMTCAGGVCGGTACHSNGGSCTTGTDCCSGNCNGTTCAPVVGALCGTLGNTCGAPTDCCSGACVGSKCVNAGGPSACIGTGDICYRGPDCCTGLCTIASGQSAGTCAVLASTGSGGCLVDGEPCGDSTHCCSRVCVGVAGAGSVCAIASGCRVIGDVCRKTSDCCGGAGNGLPASTGSGEVTCNIIPGTNPPLGTCSNPNGCDPEGDVCGLGASARHDCCACAPPKINCCKLDGAGVPRCFGSPSGGGCPNGYDGTPSCCIALDQVCTFSGECCGGAKCLPNAAGILHCGTPSTCAASGGVCTATSDCCVGLQCDVPAGAQSGTCGSPPGPDAGTQCADIGQGCGATACCTGLVCEAPGGGSACGVGQTGCTCFTTIP